MAEDPPAAAPSGTPEPASTAPLADDHAADESTATVADEQTNPTDETPVEAQPEVEQEVEPEVEPAVESAEREEPAVLETAGDTVVDDKTEAAPAAELASETVVIEEVEGAAQAGEWPVDRFFAPSRKLTGVPALVGFVRRFARAEWSTSV